MKKVILRSILIGMSILYSIATLGLAQNNELKKKCKAYVVSTAHFDTQWNWDIKESIGDNLPHTMYQNFWLFEHFPNYIFNFEGGQKYAWMKEYYPRDYARIQDYIRKGRWHVSGTIWDACDVNIPSSESFLRNLLLGQEFFKREFGVKCNDIFLPDCFGFGYAMPTLAAHCGLIGFSTQKLQWRKNVFFGDQPESNVTTNFSTRQAFLVPTTAKVPFPIGLWQGLDGSRIMAVLDAGGYGTAYHFEDISHNQRIIDRALLDPNHIAYSYYGVGDKGGSPTMPSVASIEMGIKGNGPLQIVSATSSQLYEDFLPYEEHPELPVYDGELLMDVHGPGCYTSQAALKQLNRRNEHLADAAERASVAAEILGGMIYPTKALRENWERLIWHQNHDDVTGTSIPRAYTYSWNDQYIIQNRFIDAITAAVGAVSRVLDTRTKGQPVVVYNPVATRRKDIVRAKVPMQRKPKNIRVTDGQGSVIPSQLLSWYEGQAELLFVAEVDPVSFTVFGVEAVDSRNDNANGLTVSAEILENKRYKVRLNANGDLSSVIDKNNGRELVENGKAFRLQMLTDNVSKEYPAWEIFKSAIDGPSLSVSDSVRISVVERGPVRATVCVERKMDGSVFRQDISLTSGAAEERIEISNVIEWQSTHKLLKAEFPMTIGNPEATYDLGIGYIRRGNNRSNAFEVPARQWADVTATDGDYGIAILSDSKYGWDKPSDNTLRLTLLHTPFTDNSFYNYQEHQDYGHHTFRYAIVGHEKDFKTALIARNAECFNQPLMAFAVEKHKGKMGRNYSLLKIDNSQLAVMAVKKSEDKTGYIVRINEINGYNYHDAQLTFAAPLASVEEMNGLEERISSLNTFSKNTLTLSGKAFQPRTLKVTFASEPLLNVPQNIPVDLPLNAVALTSDEMSHTGNFDGQGNSLAAELMPEIVESDGICFRVQNDPTHYNYVRCNGDTILLPEGHKATQLFLLVTSTKDDRTATFTVDGRNYQFHIPYYSGFFGQWGWNGESEGYLKEGSFGYVANHTHSEREGNAIYRLAYLYKVKINISTDSRKLVLPKDAGIALFAATLADNDNYRIRLLTETRSLPLQEKSITYDAEPIEYRKERGAW